MGIFISPQQRAYNEKLERRTTNFSVDIIQLVKILPKSITNVNTFAQIIRSSSSIGANYREANEAMSKKDFIYRLRISRKEAKETLYWLDILEQTNESHTANILSMKNECEQIFKIFCKIIHVVTSSKPSL